MVGQIWKWRDTYEVASRGIENIAAFFDETEDRSQRLFAVIEDLGFFNPSVEDRCFGGNVQGSAQN
ncbi:hypothetical protein Patl1_26512 [Pistacia atlantica]|uniref:Uncharacterized protein n=1 Tax=Pistacia atlantica TaxID=434234 RepID=A0ACC1B307_9ROSI|nr:hypothetical protein Patl1_26512 [Pistacia atlantica]